MEIAFDKVTILASRDPTFSVDTCNYIIQNFKRKSELEL